MVVMLVTVMMLMNAKMMVDEFKDDGCPEIEMKSNEILS